MTIKNYTIQNEDLGLFWSKVTKGPGCWEWAAYKVAKGYGRFGFRRKGKSMMFASHRFSYEIAKGEIPAGLVIDHICHNKGCVNPDHLRAVTTKQNNENLLSAQARNASGIRGVNWHEPTQMWRARVGHMGKNYFLGSFVSKEEAGEAARAKRLELHTHNDLDRAA